MGNVDKAVWGSVFPSWTAACWSPGVGLCRRGLALILLCLACLCPASAQTVRSGSNVDPHPGPVGEKPYEMVGRVEDRIPVATFEDCTQWEVETRNAEAYLYRTEERKLFRKYCGKLVYHGTGDKPVMTVRLKRPVTIPGAWNCVNFWNWGNGWGWERRTEMPAPSVDAIVEGADGKRHALPLGTMGYLYWFLSHYKIQDKIAFPAKFIGFQFTNGTNKKDSTVYLGPVYFYQEELKPLTFEPWPEKLPFPVGTTGILPTNKTKEFKNTVSHSPGETLFSYVGKDCELAFRYRPVTGTLSDVAVLYQGRETFPCRDGGIQLEGMGPKTKNVTRRLKSQRLDGETLVTDWEIASGDVKADVTYRFSICQKSLMIEMSEATGKVEEVTLGHAEPVVQGKLFWIPYLTFGHKARDPRVLYADGLFYFTQFDWLCSDASQLFAQFGLRQGIAVYNGGARYRCKTDGKRNPLHERLYINVSPDFAEVLPTIPNPPSAMKSVQQERQWRTKGGSDIDHEIREARRLRALGLEKVTIRYHESSWRDRGESFTFRENAAPKRGGDAALRRLISSVQACGWRVGAYTNYTDYAPVNKHWNEDWVTRTEDGNFKKAWARCYAPKPMIAVQMEAKLAPLLKRKFGMNHSYCDVHTAVTPFSRVDYDARVPGAGKFRRTLECFGRLLYNEKHAYGGPVFSEGCSHWWYAGLVDGNYAQLTSPDATLEDMLVDFDLLKMHHLQMDSGMGMHYMFFRRCKNPNYRQILATTLAYGHAGYLDGNEANLMKVYYMLQPLQKHYVMEPVRRIAYGRGNDLLDTSQALITDAYREGRIHVEYESGMKVWVNGGDKTWKPGVTVPVQAELPTWGFLATTAKDDTFAYAGMVRAGGPQATYGPKRFIDLASGPESCYLDTHGSFVYAGFMAGQGAASLKREQKSGLELIPARDFTWMGLDPTRFGMRSLTVRAVDQQGKDLGPATVRWSRGMLYVLRDDTKAFKYVLKPSEQAMDAPVSCATRYAIAGEEIKAVLPEGYQLAGNRVTWCWKQGEVQAQAQVTGNEVRVRVPAGMPLDSPAWLRLPCRKPSQASAESVLWLDFVTISPYDIQISPRAEQIGQGQLLPLRVTVSSHLKHDRTVTLKLAADKGTVETKTLTLQVPALGTAEAVTEVAAPWKSDSLTVTAQLEGQRQVQASQALALSVERMPVQDLTQVVWEGGSCRRGEPETMNLEDGYDGAFRLQNMSCGKERKMAIFTHPPWGTKGTGYVFGKTTILLPQKPVLLCWYLGRGDGTYIGDGLTYKVVVSADGKEQEVFKRHYGEFKWTPVEVDLSAYAGRRVLLKLIADCGPRDDSTADHGGWGEPKIVLKEDVMRVRLAK